jgi:hypothetical protein
VSGTLLRACIFFKNDGGDSFVFQLKNKKTIKKAKPFHFAP